MFGGDYCGDGVGSECLFVCLLLWCGKVCKCCSCYCSYGIIYFYDFVLVLFVVVIGLFLNVSVVVSVRSNFVKFVYLFYYLVFVFGMKRMNWWLFVGNLVMIRFVFGLFCRVMEVGDLFVVNCYFGR